uniref:Uncharacterized protein n=1 Tax=Sphaerodactylus townsendi TaxID=933632 RepID=A0ACB8E6E5_9SAUR
MLDILLPCETHPDEGYLIALHGGNNIEHLLSMSREVFIFLQEHPSLTQLIGVILLEDCPYLYYCTCLIMIVKLLNSVLKGTSGQEIIKKALNTDFPFSIFLARGIPGYASGSWQRPSCSRAVRCLHQPSLLHLLIAVCHFFFNISGIILWYPVPFMRVPIRLAKGLGNITAKYRWFAVFYLLLCFLLIPLAVFGLSMAGWPYLVGVCVPILALLVGVIAINVLQAKWPHVLPRCLQNWDFLPTWLRSLQPWDDVVTAMTSACGRYCCCCCKCLGGKNVGLAMEEKPKKAMEGHDNPVSLADEENERSADKTKPIDSHFALV